MLFKGILSILALAAIYVILVRGIIENVWASGSREFIKFLSQAK